MKLITAYGYGLVIIPVNTFEQFRKGKGLGQRKCLATLLKITV